MGLCVPHVCKSPEKPTEAIRFLGTGVAGCYEPPDMGARNQTRVL